MRKLTSQEIASLKALINDAELKGKNYLNSYILLNTTEPKYKEGDYVIFTCYGEQIKGNKVKDFKGKITKIFYCISPMFKGEEHIQYEIIAKDQNSETYTCYCEEYLNGKTGERFITGLTNTDLNEIEYKSKYSQSTNL